MAVCDELEAWRKAMGIERMVLAGHSVARRAQRLRVRRAPPRARREARADLARRRAARTQGLRPQGQPGQAAPLPAGLLSVGAGLLAPEHGEDWCWLGARPVAGEQLRPQAAGHGRHVVAPRAVRRLHVLQPRGGRGLVGRIRAHDVAHRALRQCRRRSRRSKRVGLTGATWAYEMPTM